jgi:hypothetical protein
MAQPAAGRPTLDTASRVTRLPQRPIIILLAALIGILLAGTIGLWVHYGTAVFFEIVRAGFIACF